MNKSVRHSPAIRILASLLLISILCLFAGLAQSDTVAAGLLTATPVLFSNASLGDPPAPWHVLGLPNANKPLTRFSIVTLDGRKVLRVQADHSYANLLHALAPATAGAKLSWRWRLDQPLLATDLRYRNGDDVPVKVCLLFDMPAENLGFIDRQFLKIARASTTEHVPAATLCYVWDHALPAGTLLNNAFTSRVRQLVVDTGEGKLGQWVTHQRDIAADFQKAFGKESATLPPLEGILVGADADNTAGSSLAYVGDVIISP